MLPSDTLGMPPKCDIDSRIDLILEVKPISRVSYQMMTQELSELWLQLEDFLSKILICPSVSQWREPVIFVKKKDGSLHLCIDY